MKTKLFAILVMFLWVVVLWPVTAEGTLITIEIEAVVDGVGDDGNFLEGQISPGDTITGWYIYDTSTPDTNPLPNYATYWHYVSPSGISLIVGGFEFRTNPDDVNYRIAISDGYQSRDTYSIRSINNLPLSNGTLIEEIYWLLEDPTEEALYSIELPTTAPVLTDWQQNILNISGPGGHGPGFGIQAHVTSAIPEPATVLFFFFGGLLLRKRR